MCPQLALCALNPHFSGRTSRICTKRRQVYSILGAFFFSVAYILGFLGVFRCFFCESFPRNIAHASLSSFLEPSFYHLLQTCAVVFFKEFLMGGISQNGSCSFFLVCILTLSGSGFRKRTNVLWGKSMCFILCSRF